MTSNGHALSDSSSMSSCDTHFTGGSAHADSPPTSKRGQGQGRAAATPTPPPSRATPSPSPSRSPPRGAVEAAAPGEADHEPDAAGTLLHMAWGVLVYGTGVPAGVLAWMHDVLASGLAPYFHQQHFHNVQNQKRSGSGTLVAMCPLYAAVAVWMLLRCGVKKQPAMMGLILLVLLCCCRCALVPAALAAGTLLLLGGGALHGVLRVVVAAGTLQSALQCALCDARCARDNWTSSGHTWSCAPGWAQVVGAACCALLAFAAFGPAHRHDRMHAAVGLAAAALLLLPLTARFPVAFAAHALAAVSMTMSTSKPPTRGGPYTAVALHTAVVVLTVALVAFLAAWTQVRCGTPSPY